MRLVTFPKLVRSRLKLAEGKRKGEKNKQTRQSVSFRKGAQRSEKSTRVKNSLYKETEMPDIEGGAGKDERRRW